MVDPSCAFQNGGCATCTKSRCVIGTGVDARRLLEHNPAAVAWYVDLLAARRWCNGDINDVELLNTKGGALFVYHVQGGVAGLRALFRQITTQPQFLVFRTARCGLLRLAVYRTADKEHGGHYRCLLYPKERELNLWHTLKNRKT